MKHSAPGTTVRLGAVRMRVHIIGHLQTCMTEIYLHIVARMADYMDTHPYTSLACGFSLLSKLRVDFSLPTVRTQKCSQEGLTRRTFSKVRSAIATTWPRWHRAWLGRTTICCATSLSKTAAMSVGTPMPICYARSRLLLFDGWVGAVMDIPLRCFVQS